MIDLCPVGALTSKPFRYQARNWELSRRRSVSGHDSLGSTLMVQSKQDRVMRVLPIENDAINECWISDRDRFGYEGLNSEERLLRPMVKRAGVWVEVDWSEAMQAAADGLKEVVSRHGGGALGVLLAPHLTLEEMHAAAKLGRALGSDNIDFRVRQRDFRAKGEGAPWLGTTISELAKMESVLLVGSTLRKEQPLIAARLRGAAKRGMAVSTVHVAKDDLLMPTVAQVSARPGELVATFAAVAAAVAQATGKRVRGELKRAITAEEQAIGASLVGKRSAIILGQYAQQHPDYSVLLSIAQEIGRITGAVVGVLPDGANAVGGWLVGALPRGGMDAKAMVAAPRAGYLVAGVEAELDMGPEALAAIAQAEFSVALSAYRNATTERAHVMLPVAPFTETAGTFVNMEGRVQTFNAMVKSQGDSRPGWKVLRVLGAMLGLDGFDFERIEDVRAQISPSYEGLAEGRLSNAIAEFDWQLQASPQSIERVDEFAIYAMDPVARRSRPLQLTSDMKRARMARMSAGTAATLQVAQGDRVRVRQGKGEALLTVGIDAAVPEGCVRIARGIPETAALGEGALEVSKVEMAAVA
jgi:NADH-quinone oxidoreductase subunit G